MNSNKKILNHPKGHRLVSRVKIFNFIVKIIQDTRTNFIFCKFTYDIFVGNHVPLVIRGYYSFTRESSGSLTPKSLFYGYSICAVCYSKNYLLRYFYIQYICDVEGPPSLALPEDREGEKGTPNPSVSKPIT